MNPSFHKNSFVAQLLTNQRLENDIYDQLESEVDQLDHEYSDPEMSKYASTITGVHQKENTQRPNTTNDQKPSSTRQQIISTPSETVTVPVIKAPDLPVNTPRPFPLTPPQPSQVYNEPTSRMQTPGGNDGSNSDSDSLPEVANMLARTRPTYSSSQANQRRSIMARDDVTRDVNTIAGAFPLTPVKRHDTESPRVPKSSYKPTCTIVETPKTTIIEILDSDTDGEHPPQAQSKTSSSGQSSIPLSSPIQHIGVQEAKRKRKRTTLYGPTRASISVSAAQPRPSKRLKTGNGRYRKHQTHWHLDGNVLVQIKDTRFKLQRSRLAQHSEWFKHTFDRIDSGEQLMGWDDESNILYLDWTGVVVEDFVALLNAMEEAITFVYKKPPFRVMASILRSSSLLSFNEFKKWASQYLEDMWSPNLADLTRNRIPFATESIALARHCNLSSTLKRAMYELVRLEGFGQAEEAGSEDGHDADDKENFEISPADYKALVKARERLTSLWLLTATSPKVFSNCSAIRPENDHRPDAAYNGEQEKFAENGSQESPVMTCTSTNGTLSVQAHAKLVIDSGIYEEYHADPMCGFQALMDAPWAEEGFCEACIDTRKKAWTNGREKAWENLGLWFGLD